MKGADPLTFTRPAVELAKSSVTVNRSSCPHPERFCAFRSVPSLIIAFKKAIVAILQLLRLSDWASGKSGILGCCSVEPNWLKRKHSGEPSRKQYHRCETGCAEVSLYSINSFSVSRGLGSRKCIAKSGTRVNLTFRSLQAGYKEAVVLTEPDTADDDSNGVAKGAGEA